MTHVAKLGDVANVVAGVGFPKDMQGRKDAEIPVFKVGDISTAWTSGQRLLRASRNYLTTTEAASLGKLVPAGATVFAKIGEALRLNRRAVLAQPSLVDNNVMGLVPRPGVLAPMYLFYFMQTVDLGKLSRATAVPSIRKSDVGEIKVPLPPTANQESIVAEIEKQFSRLDEAVANLKRVKANLKRVKANLKRYRSAVLKAAVEGRLVPTEAEITREQARIYETGTQLLDGVIGERQSHRNKAGKKRDAVGVRVPTRADLPEAWAWASVEEVGRLQLGRQRAPKYHSGLNMRPYLRVQNVFEDRIDLDDVMEMDFSPADFERFALQTDDILLNEGQSPELLGRPAMYRGELPGACFTNTLIRFQAYRCVLAKFAVIVFRHYMHAGRFVDESTITTNIAHLSLGRLCAVEFPVPPLAEQHRIIAEVDRRLSIVREVESEVDANLKRAQALRQAVLARAFAAPGSTYAGQSEQAVAPA